jgi:hypothetical protein
MFGAVKLRISWIMLALLGSAASATADPSIRCDNLSTDDLSVDGLLDDWQGKPLTRVGNAEPAIELRCSWDGKALALALDIKDQRIVRVRSGAAHEDKVDIKIAAGGKPTVASVKPGNPIAKAVIAKPARVAVADSLQPKGFSIEARFPAGTLAGLSAATPSLALSIVFHDSDAATGGADFDMTLAATIELGDRKDLLDDFLRTVKLRRSDVKLDTLAELDPDRAGKERVVAGGTVIGVLTDKFAYVALPAAKPADVLKVELLPVGNRGQSIVSALVKQSGNGGSRELLMLWTMSRGSLEPLASIEVKKELAGSVLEASYKVAKGKKGPELWVEPKPAIGFTEQTWNEEPAQDVDSIVLPWDAKKGGIAYSIEGKPVAITRRDLPKPKKR